MYVNTYGHISERSWIVGEEVYDDINFCMGLTWITLSLRGIHGLSNTNWQNDITVSPPHLYLLLDNLNFASQNLLLFKRYWTYYTFFFISFCCITTRYYFDMHFKRYTWWYFTREREVIVNFRLRQNIHNGMHILPPSLL